MAIDGCLLVDKPRGMTSFDVVRKIKRLAGTKKVGHTGTLDPDASGLLPIVLGIGTKLAQYLILDSKQYSFELVLGRQTTTDDDQGEDLFHGSFDAIERADIEAALPSFRGEIQQRPPKFSAIKVEGRRAYDMAREGIDFELDPRPVTVHSFELLGELSPEGVISAMVSCGSGTYIRALARDLGQQLGCFAHARLIRRLQVGSFTIDQAHSLEELEEQGVDSFLLSPAKLVTSLPSVTLDEAQILSLRRGQFLEHPEAERLELEQTIAALDDEGELVAIAKTIERSGTRLIRPKTVLHGIS